MILDLGVLLDVQPDLDAHIVSIQGPSYFAHLLFDVLLDGVRDGHVPAYDLNLHVDVASSAVVCTKKIPLIV